MMTRSLAVTLNALGLCGIALVLAAAFAAQLILNELPCPLCLCNASSSRCSPLGPF
jgi:disulfide bond formation protein DsbB